MHALHFRDIETFLYLRCIKCRSLCLCVYKQINIWKWFDQQHRVQCCYSIRRLLAIHVICIKLQLHHQHQVKLYESWTYFSSKPHEMTNSKSLKITTPCASIKLLFFLQIIEGNEDKKLCMSGHPRTFYNFIRESCFFLQWIAAYNSTYKMIARECNENGNAQCNSNNNNNQLSIMCNQVF